MIQQRINAGLKRAVEQGKQLGRPRISPEIEKRIQGMRAKNGMLATDKEVGVGSGTVQRIAREMRAERPFEGAITVHSGGPTPQAS
jgi:DNA invertase Pin-like site-specific DNA recombinase